MPLFAKFLQEFLRTVGDFPVSAVSLVLEPFFAKVVASEDKDTRAAGVLTLAVLSTQIQGLLSSLLVPGSSLLESLVDEAIPRAVQDFASPTFSQILAMQCLNHVLHEVAALPPPIAILDSLITLLRPSSQWIAAILSSLTPAVQIYLFTMLHTFVTLPSCEFSIDLQQFAIDTGLFLRILRCALFDASSFQRIIARCLVVLLCYQNESAALFLRRCFPKTLIDSLNKGTFEYSFATLLKSNESNESKESNEPNEPNESFPPLQKAVWSAVSVLASPQGSLNFPAFFKLYEASTETYQLVWGDTQRLELQQWIDAELYRWDQIYQADPRVHWNIQQAWIRYASYDYDLILYDLFLQYIAQTPAKFGCSSLIQATVSSDPRLSLGNPSLFLTSVYARFLTAKTVEKQRIFLQCLRVIYHQYQGDCRVFFDLSHVVELIEEEQDDTHGLLDVLLEFLQSLLTYSENVEQICRDVTWVSVLFKILMQTHVNGASHRAVVILDIFYGCLEKTIGSSAVPQLPLSPVLEHFCSTHALKILVDLLFHTSSKVVTFATLFLLRILSIPTASLQYLYQLPIIDAILLLPSLDPIQVQLLKLLLHERSLLTGILPDALVYGLQVLSESRFADIYNGNTTSALIIWTSSMRSHLQTVIHAHIDGYIAKLAEDPSTCWTFVPLPHIHYTELDDDVYCGKYYLRRLMDLEHPTSLKNPKALLLALKSEWIREGKRRGCALSMEQARMVLGVDESADEMTLIRAFWDSWNTDVNHDTLQLALDMLTGAVITATSPIPNRLLLIVQTQCFLYQHYHSRLHKLLFPSFKMLVAQIQVVVENPEQLALPELVSSLVSLVLLTCVCSVENAENFVQCGGLTVLYHLLRWNDAKITAGDENAVQLLYHQVTILVHLSHHSSLHGALADATNITDYLAISLCSSLPVAVLCSILEYFTNLSSEASFKASLLHTSVSVFITAIPLLFRYNADEEKTREQEFNEQCNRIGQQLRQSRPSSVSASSIASDIALNAIPGSVSCIEDSDDTPLVTLAQSDMGGYSYSHNSLAKRVVQFLANVCNNSVALTQILTSLLTPSLIGLLLEKNMDHLLAILNSDFYESPFIIWTKAMRSQLLEFLEDQRQKALRHEGDFVQDVSQFVYDAIRNELLIADVYVRVFNKLKPKQFVKAPKYFTGLLSYLRLQRLGPKVDDVWIGYYETNLGEDYVLMMLTSLHILLSNSPELANSVQSADDLLLLFSFLLPRYVDDAPQWLLDNPCTEKAVEILALLLQSPRLASLAVETHATDILTRILIQKDFQLRTPLFVLLHHVCLFSQGFEHALFASGLWVLFLHLILLPAEDALATIRQLSVAVLQGWSHNEDVQAISRVTFRRLLPEYMVLLLTEDNPDALHAFDASTCTAEMIWNAQMKATAATVVRGAFEGFVEAFREGREFVLDEDAEVVYEQLQNETVIGGVFVKIYLNYEAYQLRQPQEFVDALMKEFCGVAALYDNSKPENIATSAEEENKRAERLDLAVSALCKVCRLEGPAILEYFASSGYVARIVEQWELCEQKHALNGPISTACCSIVKQIAETPECLPVLIQKPTLLRILLNSLREGSENALDVSAILLSLFKARTTELVEYVMELNMISLLFSCVKNPVQVECENAENVATEIKVGEKGKGEG